METGKSVTFTRDEIIEQLTPVLISILKDSVSDLVNDGQTLKMFDNFSNFKKHSDESIADMWCEYLSENWLGEHSDVDEVLMLTYTNTFGVKIKLWLASK